MQLRSAALTDIGKLRRFNEDRFVQDDRLHLYGVADGVGGLPHGAVAAQHAIDALTQRVKSGSIATGPALAEAILAINQEVMTRGHHLSPRSGIGSTLTCGLFRQRQLHLAHVGDSRCYVCRAGALQLLTEDHTVENEMLRRTVPGPYSDFLHEQNRQALTRCMGQPMDLPIDVSSREILADDRYLFVTDGIFRLLRESELAKALRSDAPPADVLADLVRRALERGGPDNATGVLVVVDSLT